MRLQTSSQNRFKFHGIRGGLQLGCFRLTEDHCGAILVADMKFAMAKFMGKGHPHAALWQIAQRHPKAFEERVQPLDVDINRLLPVRTAEIHAGANLLKPYRYLVAAHEGIGLRLENKPETQHTTIEYHLTFQACAGNNRCNLV